jgi:hypothetical protein
MSNAKNLFIKHTERPTPRAKSDLILQGEDIAQNLAHVAIENIIGIRRQWPEKPAKLN